MLETVSSATNTGCQSIRFRTHTHTFEFRMSKSVVPRLESSLSLSVLALCTADTYIISREFIAKILLTKCLVL